MRNTSPTSPGTLRSLFLLDRREIGNICAPLIASFAQTALLVGGPVSLARPPRSIPSRDGTLIPWESCTDSLMGLSGMAPFFTKRGQWSCKEDHLPSGAVAMTWAVGALE